MTQEDIDTAAATPIRALPEPPPESSVHAQRDHYKALAQAAWQRLAEVEYLLRVERGLRHVPPIKAAEGVL